MFDWNTLRLPESSRRDRIGEAMSLVFRGIVPDDSQIMLENSFQFTQTPRLSPGDRRDLDWMHVLNPDLSGEDIIRAIDRTL